MKLWRALWLGIKAAFLPRTRSCANCSYMREWGCSASCGNDAGVVCGAWFPKTDDKGGWR